MLYSHVIQLRYTAMLYSYVIQPCYTATLYSHVIQLRYATMLYSYAENNNNNTHIEVQKFEASVGTQLMYILYWTTFHLEYAFFQ